MKEMIPYIFFLFLVILLLITFPKKENYSSLPDLSLGYQWGSSPKNLYRSPEEMQNYFADDLRRSLEEEEDMDNRYARGPGFGIGDIRRKMNTGLHATQKVVYR